MKGFGIGLILSALVKAIIKIIDALFTLIANLLLYFGLWIPFVYMLFACGLLIWGGLDLKVAGVERNLFYFGLSLALLGSLIITIRNLFVVPIKDFAKYKQAKRDYRKKQDEKKKQELYKKNPSKYFIKYEGAMPPKEHPVYGTSAKERDRIPPLIYRSNQDPRLIIHEFDDRFEIFREDNGRIYLIDTKSKTKKSKKKR